MVFLATTALEEFWDKEQDIVFLGEWCKINDNLPKKNVTMPFLWDNANKKDKALKECIAIYENIVPKISKVLNKTHKLNKSDRYWEIIIGIWLMLFIQTIYDRYLNIKKFIEKYPKFDTIILAKKSFITPMEFLDYLENIDTDGYNLQLYSQILNFLDYDFVKKDLALKQKSVYKKDPQIPKKRFFTKSNPSIKLTSPLFSHGFKSFEKLALEANGEIEFSYSDDSYDLTIKKDDTMRKRFATECKQSNDFEKLLFFMFEHNFPMLFLEGYDRFNKIALKAGKPKAKLSVTSGGLVHRYLYMFWIANYIDDIRLIYIQHGGFYGVNNIFAGEYVERKLSDKFLTWGWQEDNNTIPSTHEKISQNINPSKHGYLLYALNASTRYLYGLDFQLMGSSVKKIYIPKAISFLNNIDKKEEILCRNYTDSLDYGFGVGSSIKNKFDSIRFDDHSQNFHNTAKGARLCIIDYLGTVFLETLAMNFPTVIFIDKNMHSFRKPELIQLLIDTKILFYDEVEAAHHVNSIFVDIDSWWFSNKVQNARKEFCYHYARASENWAADWMKVFNKILKEK